MRADGRARLTAAQIEARDRGDAGQRLAAKAQRADLRQLARVAQLAGRVAHDRQQQVVGMDALAVVTHRDKPEPALLELNIDAARASVDRVVDQLLDHRRRPLDDLARGDLVDGQRAQEGDPGQRRG